MGHPPMNPEMNSTGSTVITYGYDNNNRLTSKTEPAPNAAWGSSSTVTLTYSYDALNRLLDTTFSDGTTLKASHRYDYATFQGQSFTNPIGREVAALTVNSSGGTVASTFASYDTMGRVASTVQCNPGVSGCKTFTGSYDKLGDLTSLAYPGNGFTVTYGYDSAARLTTATDSTGVIYAQAPTYLASGAIQEFTSPNFANNKYHVNYNNRIQPIEIWAGSAQGSAALFDKQYSYGTTGANNGNIYTITNVKDSTRTQGFTYDPLNRLITAGDNGHWANSYTYDAWGNLTNKTPGSPAGENMNQPADTNNHLSGLTYDAAGNVKNDGLGGAFVFDGENRITTAGSVTYTYDADGRRIQKSSGTNYWYGPDGQVFAETDLAGNWANYIYFGSQRLARNVSGDIKYYITDHLRSTAMFVDKAGTAAAILDDNDMYPWGGVVPGVGKTTSNNTVKFTGKYRDMDTAANLDYFGARYYSNTVGRFMSPDWAAAPTTVPYAKWGDPQSLNLYSYTENGPINRIDADGHWEDADCSVCNQGDSGFSVAPTAGTEIGLVVCSTCEPGQPPNSQSNSSSNSQSTDPSNSQSTSPSNQTTNAKSKPTNQPVDPAPTGPDGKPAPPSVPVPGCPECTWKWFPDAGNDRGGQWKPDNYPKTPGGIPDASWDPGSRGGPGHWDVNDGKGQKERYYPDGRQMPVDVAHPPGWKPIYTQVAAAAAAVGAGYLIYRAIRMIPSLVIPPLWPTIIPNAVIP